MCIGAAAGAAGVATQGYVFFTHDLPGIHKLKNYTPFIITNFYASKGELIGEFAKERRFVLPIDQIPPLLANAFIAAEDKNFWKHDGVDYEAIVKH